MNKPTSFDCHSFLDNHIFAIVEISTEDPSIHANGKNYQWLLVHKVQLTVSKLQLKSRDDSAAVHERFFDMGYLKFDSSAGVFITQEKQELHPLSNLSCKDIPPVLLEAVENYLQ